MRRLGRYLYRAKKVSAELLDTQGLTPEEWIRRLADESALKCLIDYPHIRPGSNFGLAVVSEWGDRPKAAKPEAPRETYGQIIPSDNFKNGMRQLERSIACFRVFWEPAESRIVDEALGPTRLREIVEREVGRYTPRAWRTGAD